MEISRQLRPAAVELSLGGLSVEEVLRELAALIAGADGGLNADAFLEGLLRRERMLSTAMGGGIAFPHCTSDRLAAPGFALGISRNGIAADSPDGGPVHIFFAVISPTRNPDAHLDALAAASRVFTRPEVRGNLMAAESADAAIAAIAAAEER